MGPLKGLRIVEIAGLGPAPFAGMMLADHGAEVIRVERPGGDVSVAGDPTKDALLRSRTVARADLKSPDGVALVRDLAHTADGLIEGFRPGVMERLGLGPDVLLGDNPKLVYGRMTGWGQTGPLAGRAGHDIDYIAVAGALHAIGPAEKPVVPLNLVGDFGGGGMLLAFGMLAALHHVRAGGDGQVVDCAMTDGTALLTAMTHSFRAQGTWADTRASNMLDGAAPFYDTYACADGKHLAVGAIEPQFYAELMAKLGLSAAGQFDRAAWPVRKRQLADLFRTRARDDWCALLDGDACVAPVLSLAEAPLHPHNAERGTFIEAGGVVQPAPAPRYSRTPTVPPRMAAAHQDDVDLARSRA